MHHLCGRIVKPLQFPSCNKIPPVISLRATGIEYLYTSIKYLNLTNIYH